MDIGSRTRAGVSILAFAIAGALFISKAPALARSQAVSASLELHKGFVLIKHGDVSAPVSLGSPRFVFNGPPVSAGSAISQGKADIGAGQTMETSFAPASLEGSARLDVKMLLRWSPEEGVLRKWARFRLTGTKSPLLLKEVILDDLDASDRKVEMLPGDIQSYPAFLDGFFAGIEFPIAATRLEKGRLILAHRPGLTLQPGVWYESRKAVFGVAEKGYEKRDFERYIMAHHPGPKGIHVNYNSWWTSPAPYYTEADILGLMRTFEEKLYKPYKVSFDTFCIDMGWSNPKSLWEIDTKLFPEGFSRIQQSASAMNTRLGLWISPSSQYPPALDNDWVEKNGYETFADGWRYACLGGKRYENRFRDQLLDMIKRYGIQHVKFDGYQFICPESDHGHAPGLLSAEPCADGIIDIFQSIRKADPKLWMEPTCFGFNPSPWWAFYTNSIIGTFGDDAPCGRIPCPVYRESYTTARDYFNLQGANTMAMPVAAQEVLGIVHQSEEPFMNDAVMTLMRGHLFLTLYVNPKFMDDARWKSFAEFLTWARANASAIEETEPLLPISWQGGKCPKITRDVPMPREPYGYAHWNGDSALVALRNPWMAPQKYKLKLSGLASGASGLSAVSLYPEPRLYGDNLKTGDTLEVSLAPYETLVLSIEKNASAAKVATAEESLRPGAEVSTLKHELVRAEFEGGRQQFGLDWTSSVGDAASSLQASTEAEVTVTAPNAELLVLREGPDPLVRPLCTVRINGKEVAESSSACSETGWASGSPSPDKWMFLRFPLPQGKSRVQVDMTGISESDRLSAWVWTTKPGKGARATYPNALPGPEMISLGGVSLFDSSVETARVVQRPRPVDRIDGAFLDALTPVSTSQGFGTLQKNRSVTEKPIIIAGKRYIRGLGTHAPSKVVYSLDGKFRRFQVWAGVDGGANNPSITLEVLIDGQKKWESGLMKKESPAKQVDIDVTGAKTLELLVGDGGDGINADWVDWADAKLLK